MTAIFWHGLELEIEVECDPYVAGFTSGAPGDCYPDSGGTVDLVGLSRNGRDWTWLLRTGAREELDRLAFEACVQEAAEAAEEAAYDNWR